MLFLTSLNSGSNANCYYIGNSKEAVLVDAGLSSRETVKRMKRLGLDIKNVKAVFISHEHADHISGLATLQKRFQLPVYITPATLKNSRLKLQKELVFSFNDEKEIQIGDLQIVPFRKFHDADDPHSFRISSGGVHVSVLTDIGHASRQVIKHFKKCHAVFLETNYDEEMLMNGSYPSPLKKRISSDTGHLSNAQALDLFLKHRQKHLQLLILSHLSKNNNNPELVKNIFEKHAGSVKIVVAGRYEETALFEIKQTKQISSSPVSVQAIKKYSRQLSLFQ